MIAYTVTMHSKSGCPHCDTAREFLNQHGIPHTEFKHDDDADRAVMYDALGLTGTARTVPQITLHDADHDDMHHIGGARELLMSGIQSLFTGEATR